VFLRHQRDFVLQRGRTAPELDRLNFVNFHSLKQRISSSYGPVFYVPSQLGGREL
jgi:hypothetical protein